MSIKEPKPPSGMLGTGEREMPPERVGTRLQNMGDFIFGKSAPGPGTAHPADDPQLSACKTQAKKQEKTETPSTQLEGSLGGEHRTVLTFSKTCCHEADQMYFALTFNRSVRGATTVESFFYKNCNSNQLDP